MTLVYPNVKVKLVGTDGNAFAVIGTCQDAMRKAGATQAQIESFIDEAMEGDYDHLLRTAMKYFDVE